MSFFKQTSAFFTSAYRKANRYTCFYHLTNRIIQYLMQEIKKNNIFGYGNKTNKTKTNSMTDKKSITKPMQSLLI